MKKILYSFLLICPLLFISSCEKDKEEEYTLNGTWDIVDITYDGVSQFDPSIEDGYFTAGGWTFNDDGSCVHFIQHSSGGYELMNATWILIGTNQLIITYQDIDDDTYSIPYTITKLNATSCELSNDDVEFGNTTLFLSR